MLWLLTSVGWLLAANPYLAEGQRQFDALRYPEAEVRLRLAADVPNATREERRAVFDLLARAQLAQGKQTEAEATYRHLLMVDPSAPGPRGVSPKVSATYQRAKAALYAKGYARLTVIASSAETLELTLIDPWDAVRSVVYLEAGDTGTWDELAATPSELMRLTLAPIGSGESRRYYVEARDADGEVLATVGSAAAPKLRTGPARQVAQANPDWIPSVNGGPPAPVARVPHWPGWALTGVAAVAVGVMSFLVVSAVHDSQSAGTAATAVETRALDQSARAKASWAYGLGAVGVAAGGASLYFLWPREEPAPP